MAVLVLVADAHACPHSVSQELKVKELHMCALEVSKEN